MPYYCPHLKHIHSQKSGTKKETEKNRNKNVQIFWWEMDVRKKRGETLNETVF
jgi:hypothetical protein